MIITKEEEEEVEARCNLVVGWHSGLSCGFISSVDVLQTNEAICPGRILLDLRR
jgi:hypothetical protein